MTVCRIYFCIFDDIDRFLCSFTLENDDYSESVEDESVDDICKHSLIKYDITIKVDGYFLSTFQNILSQSIAYRRLVIQNILKFISIYNRDIFIKVVLILPKREVLDYEWNDRVASLIVERSELDHAMSWLSTLGGAFSALGDSFEHCVSIIFTLLLNF